MTKIKSGWTNHFIHLIRTITIQSLTLVIVLSFIPGLLVGLAATGTLLSAIILVFVTTCSAVFILQRRNTSERIIAGLYIWAGIIILMPIVSYITTILGTSPETLRGIPAFGNPLLNHAGWLSINAILAVLVAVLAILYGYE